MHALQNLNTYYLYGTGMFLKIHSKSVVIQGYLSEWIANDQSPFGFDHKDQRSQSGIMEGECSMAYCQHFSENSDR